MFRFLIRRRYIVDWKLQGNLVRHGLLYGALVLAVVVVGMFAPLLWEFGSGAGMTEQEDHSVVMLYLHERFWPLALLSALIVTGSAIAFSHRIAGPLVRFKRNLRLLADGKMAPPLKTRPGDYLQEEVECLNAAIDGVRARTGTARRAAAELRRRLDGAGGDELIAACDELLERLDEFEEVRPDAARGQHNGASATPRPVIAGRFEA